MKQLIINECKKYGYEFAYERNGFLEFKNEKVIEELQLFQVEIDYDLEMVKMALIIDLGSWNEALESDLDNIEEILDNIKNWLCVENLNSIEEWLVE